jgi:primase-polymerase (primpol)-like protein
MAAEMSSGLLAFGHIYNQPTKVSMLVVKMVAEYHKKGTGKLKFICEDGTAIKNAIAETIQTGDGISLICKCIGINEAGEDVATFHFTWSFKAKR